MKLILASTSSYRAALLQQLHLPFLQMDPAYTEIAHEGESPGALCRRLAMEKAGQVAAQEPGGPYLIIGSDQVAYLPDGQLLGKPGDFDAALAQLQACRGKWVTFETAICLLTDTGRELTQADTMQVRYRDLDDAALTRYLNIDRPFDCAGAIKAESVGVTIISETRGRDINTLLGLPLILLVDMLAALGIDVLKEIN